MHLGGVASHAVDGEKEVQEGERCVQPQQVVPAGRQGMKLVRLRVEKLLQKHTYISKRFCHSEERLSAHPEFRFAIVVRPKLYALFSDERIN